MGNSVSKSVRHLQAAIDSIRHNDVISTVRDSLCTGPLRIPYPPEDSREAIDKTIGAGPGIYLFEMARPERFAEFADTWLNASISNYPQIVSSRFSVWKNEQSPCVPMYLGKAMRLRSRVMEHLYHGPAKRTYSLKLSARKNIGIYPLNLYTVEFPWTEDIATILALIEGALREEIQPIIGRQ